jgi:hypothetical protein
MLIMFRRLALVVAFALVLVAPARAQSLPNREVLAIVHVDPAAFSVVTGQTSEAITVTFALPLLAGTASDPGWRHYRLYGCFQPAGHYSTRCNDWDGAVDVCPGALSCTGYASSGNTMRYTIDTSRVTQSGRFVVWVFYVFADGTAVGPPTDAEIPLTVTFVPPSPVRATPPPVFAIPSPTAAPLRSARVGAVAPGVAVGLDRPTTRFMTTCTPTYVALKPNGDRYDSRYATVNAVLAKDSVITVFADGYYERGSAENWYQIAPPTAALFPPAPAWVPQRCLTAL